MSRLWTAARAYADKGWAVFPVKPGEKVPATAHGCLDASSDPAKVDAWWGRDENFNIGVACGQPSGIFAVDLDGPEGLEAWTQLEGRHGLVRALWAATPSGGFHGVFALPPGTLGNTAKKLGDGIDTRGDGGYIVVSPSVHPNGGRYRWLDKIRPPAVPGWLLRLLRPMPKQTSAKPWTADRDATGYVDKAIEGECATVASCGEGTRNHTLNAAAFNLGTLVGAGLTDEATVRERLSEAARACGLADREIVQTLGSGLKAGQANPRQGVKAA